MVKTYCDGCGKEITGPYSPYNLQFEIRKISYGNSKRIDLCRCCCETLNDFLEGMRKNERSST